MYTYTSANEGSIPSNEHVNIYKRTNLQMHRSTNEYSTSANEPSTPVRTYVRTYLPTYITIHPQQSPMYSHMVPLDPQMSMHKSL